MVDQKLQEIITAHALELVKKINLRVIVLIDPSYNNPYEGPLAVFAPGMLHITTEKLTELMTEFELETEKFLKGIILKEENRLPRTIYISTDTRRIFLRLIKVPYKNKRLSRPTDKEKAEYIYYLGISVIKDLSRVGKETPDEKPQAVFDRIDLVIKDLEKFL